MHSFLSLLGFSLMLIYNCSYSNAQEAGTFQGGFSVEGNYHWQEDHFSVTGGVTANLWITDFIGLHYDIQFGGDRHYGFTMNTGFGQIGMVHLLADTTLGFEAGEKVLLGIVSLAVPEGVIFAINPDDNFIVMPYINPLEIHVLGNDTDYKLRCGGEVGVEFQLWLDDIDGISLNTKVGARYLYSKRRPSIVWGLSLMFAL